MLVLGSLDELPKRPVYPKKNIRRYQGDPVTSGNKLQRGFYVRLSDPRNYETISAEYRKGGKVLYVFGVARYADMSGKAH